MTKIFDVIAEPHNPANRGPVLFYDEDREKALAFIRQYVKKYGFTYEGRGISGAAGRFSCATIALRERESTGEEISYKQYHEIFDTVTGEVLKNE